MTPMDLGRISSLQDAHTIFASRDTISVIFGLLVAIYQNVSPDATLKSMYNQYFCCIVSGVDIRCNIVNIFNFDPEGGCCSAPSIPVIRVIVCPHQKI